MRYNSSYGEKYVFIDYSGDPGLKNSDTSHLVVAAVLLVDHENLEKLTAAICGFRAGLGWNELDEFKFSSTRKSVTKELLKFISKYKFESYIAVVNKTKITSVPQFYSGETLYNYVIKELLLKLKLPNETNIIIDGVYDKKQAQRTRTYLRQALTQSGVEKCRISFVDSRKESLIQLADCCWIGSTLI